jgi:hypothetical protein
MALANIAVLLAVRGLKVLAVDWDLEAPGLERYFSYFKTQPSGDGLLNLLLHSRSSVIEKSVWRVDGDFDSKPFSLDFLPSGKETDDNYIKKLEQFDWEQYFVKGGGQFLEELRERCKKDYDITLIDSRTGLSDAGGVCTIQLPDIVVAIFSANYQSLYGVRDAMRLAQLARNDLAYDRLHLAVLPLPARFGSRTEFRESQEWVGRFAEVLGEFYNDWLPKWLDPRPVVEKLKIPQVDFFGFGEKLAVVEHGMTDPDSLGSVYDRVAKLLSNDLRDVETVLGIDRPPAAASAKPDKRITDMGYKYDVYVSYSYQSTLSEWIRAFVERLQTWLSVEIGETAKLFFDYNELNLGQTWISQTTSNLVRSKTLLAILTPEYFSSSVTMNEWTIFVDRERESPGSPNLTIPVLLKGDEKLINRLGSKQWHDMRSLPLHISAFTDKLLSLQLAEQIRILAKDIAELSKRAPPFDSRWEDSDHVSPTTLLSIDSRTLQLLLNCSSLKTPEDLPDDTIIRGNPRLMEEVFGSLGGSIDWAAAKRKFRQFPATANTNLRTLKELSRGAYEICNNSRVAPTIQGVIFVGQGPKRYRPAISRSKLLSDGTLSCDILMVEEVGGPLQFVDKNVEVLLTALRMAVRIRWEVVRPFHSKARMLARLDPGRARLDLQTCLNNIFLESELRGVGTPADVWAALTDEEDRSVILKIMEGITGAFRKIWRGIGFEADAQTFGEVSDRPFLEEEITLLEAGLKELEKLNNDFLEIAAVRVTELIRRELGGGKRRRRAPHARADGANRG